MFLYHSSSYNNFVNWGYYIDAFVVNLNEDDVLSGMTSFPTLHQQISNHNHTIQDKLFQTQVSMFQTVCFQNCTSASNDGALFCTPATHFLVESSSFFSCTIIIFFLGGAICYDNENGGQSVLHKSCGYD